ncbi:MAG: ATP-binding protein [Gemmatimonadaceae bacterium]
MPDASTGDTTLGSILESLVPVMAQAGSAGDAAVLLLERLVSRRSCTAGWIGRLTEHGDLVGLAEVDVGLDARAIRIGAGHTMHPLVRATVRPGDPPHVASVRELGMEQAALVPMPVLEPARFALESMRRPWAWGVMALAVSRRPTADEMELWTRLARALGSVIARLERDADHVAAAAAAARDRALLSDVFEHLPDAIVITDAENRVVIENAGARALLRTPDEGASEGLRRATELNTLLMSSFLSRAVLQGTGTGESRDVTLVNPVDGTDLTFEVLSVRLTGRRERELLTVSLLRNVTDLKRVTEALTEQYSRAREAERDARSERDRLEIILENVADPVVVTDMAAGVLLMNRAAERLFQAPDEPSTVVAERSAASFSVRANDTIFTSYISDFALDPDETRRTTFRLMDPSRKTDFPVEAIAGKVLNERGEPIAIVTVVHDLSVAEEKEKLASQLLVLNRDLEARVAEATSELEERNRRLELQRDELRRASQLKSEFLASMSHELRTPLNAIIGHTQNILEGLYGQLPPQVQMISRRIEQNSKQLLMLINDILDLAKIEAGEMPMTIDEVDLIPLVEDVLRTIEPMAQRRSLTLTLDAPASRARIRSDEMKLRQILTNLGSNAVKFTTKGGVRVRVTDLGAGVSIAVEDTGVGIAHDLIEAAFQDFRQLDQSYTRQEGGTGLGLSITRRLVGLLGGHLFVRSKLGVGSHFRVELPIFPGSMPRAESAVLVIEDGPVATDPTVGSAAKGA